MTEEPAVPAPEGTPKEEEIDDVILPGNFPQLWDHEPEASGDIPLRFILEKYLQTGPEG